MKKTIVFLLIIVSQISNGQFWKTKEKLYGNGNITSETRQMSEYDKLVITGPYEVKIVKGNNNKIEVTADENLLQAIEIFVKSGKLIIRTHPDFNIKKFTQLTVEVPTDYLYSIKLTGSGNIYNNYKFDWNNLKLSITGSGNMEFGINTKHTDASITGSGEIHLTGKTDDIEIGITGSGEVRAEKLEAIDGKVVITGSGTARVHVIKNLNTKIFGSGDVYYYGEPEYLKAKSYGTGNITYKRKA